MNKITQADLLHAYERTVEINKANGWYEKEMPFHVFRVKVISELIEAEQEISEGKDLTKTYYEIDSNGNQKPCGFVSELADVVIRLLDGVYRFGAYECFVQSIGTLEEESINAKDSTITVKEMYVDNSTNYLYKFIDTVILFLHECNPVTVLTSIILTCQEVLTVDIMHAINEKLDYNATRGYRHGNKVF